MTRDELDVIERCYRNRLKGPSADLFRDSYAFSRIPDLIEALREAMGDDA